MDPVSQVFQGFTAYQRSAALKGAIALDLFSAIAEGNATAEALATRCQASTRGVRILCDYLAAVGFLHKTDGRYTLDPESGPLLDRHSPLYVGSAIRFLASPVVMQSFADVAGAVRKGGTVVDAGGATAPEHPMWVRLRTRNGSARGVRGPAPREPARCRRRPPLARARHRGRARSLRHHAGGAEPPGLGGRPRLGERAHRR